VIEIDGEIHNNDVSKEYDLNRTAELEKFGIRVIRFTNDQVLYKLEWVIYRILKVIIEFTPLLRLCVAATAKQGRGAGGQK